MRLTAVVDAHRVVRLVGGAAELSEAKTEADVSTKRWETVSYELSTLLEECEEQRC